MKKQNILKELIVMSRNIGKPENDYVIIAEGNTSAKIDDESFFVKASGYYLSNITKKGFIEVKIDILLDLLNRSSMSDDEIKEGLINASVQYKGIMPSIESIIHAICISHTGAQFVCHTHPTAVNSIACSANAKEALSGRLFPDEVIFCSPSILYIEWAQPGLTLGKKVLNGIMQYKKDYNIPPRVIVMQNHGLITIGEKRAQVEKITAMFVKACKVLIGTYTLGGPHFMTDKDVKRIFDRPDEKHRERVIFKKDK